MVQASTCWPFSFWLVSFNYPVALRYLGLAKSRAENAFLVILPL